MRKSEGLRPRQVECLTLASQGMISVQIAKALGISFRTVDQHIEEARARLDAGTRGEAIAKARALGLI